MTESNVSLPSALNVLTTIEDDLGDTSGSYDVQMTLKKSSSFLENVDQNFSVIVPDPIFVEIKSSLENINLLARTCWATPR